MKLTKSKLKAIIREELMNEGIFNQEKKQLMKLVSYWNGADNKSGKLYNKLFNATDDGSAPEVEDVLTKYVETKANFMDIIKKMEKLSQKLK